VNTDLDRLEDKLSALRSEAGLKYFPESHHAGEVNRPDLDKLDLKPFDKLNSCGCPREAGELLRQGDSDLAFCELDNDLQPWGGTGETSRNRRLYDSARVGFIGLHHHHPEPPEDGSRPPRAELEEEQLG